jgi:hypothetical protein
MDEDGIYQSGIFFRQSLAVVGGRCDVLGHEGLGHEGPVT